MIVHVDVQSPRSPPQLNFGSGFGVDENVFIDLNDEHARVVKLVQNPDRFEVVDPDSSTLTSVIVELKS